MFEKVSTSKDVDQVVILARDIWTEHYSPIIGIEQVNYMLEKYQSKDSIIKQISDENYTYYFIKNDEKVIGYFSFQIKKRQLFLSKIYVHSKARGLGFGKLTMAFIEQLAQQHKVKIISLTVNKHNSNTIAAYYKFGFIKVGEICVDIGQGYEMDDYQMELEVN